VLVLSDEMPGPCTLDSIQLLCGSDVYNQGIFRNAGVYACRTAVAELDSAYEENYAGNEPTPLLVSDTLVLQWTNGEWQGLRFDHPFSYEGNDNLILEFRWQGDDGGSVYNLGYYTSGNRALDAKSPTAENGTPRNYMPRFRIFYSLTGVVQEPVAVPSVVPTATATPNPFRSGVTLRAAGTGPLSASVYSSAGDLVRHVAGSNSSSEVCWDGCDEYGRRARPGAYICRLRSGSRVEAVHLILQR
jgi:hypothetical protein